MRLRTSKYERQMRTARRTFEPSGSVLARALDVVDNEVHDGR
jgi:hypothetical protein